MTLDTFLQDWKRDDNGVKPLFLAMRDCLRGLEDVELDYKGRPGVSHSLRARRRGQQRPLFALVDVIDDDPGARWLSVCFYADLVSDPRGMGDEVPGGLLGEDARCFDLESPEEGGYVLERLKEAHASAGRGAA